MENMDSSKTPSNDGITPTTDMPLRRLTLFSSGVGFFEHSGDVAGNTEVILPLNAEDIDDALKSLVINDPDSSPAVSYLSEDTLWRTMKGLSIDLLTNSHLTGLLSSLKGAEIEVLLPNPLKGRILLVEYRREPDPMNKKTDLVEREAFLSLLTSEGIRIISLKEIGGFKFSDPKIHEDANRALDLIRKARDSSTRDLSIKLPGKNSRKVTLNYVIPAPVWKVSYRLDLSKEKPFLQGWAIVDNDSDTDWEQVELSLVTGRPVSFVQNLYAPLHLSRPTLPLSIAGIAKANLYDSGTTPKPEKAARGGRVRPAPTGAISAASTYNYGDSALAMAEAGAQYNALDVEEMSFLRQGDDFDDFSINSGMIETAHGRAAGDQFEFTVKTPVSIVRRQSAMLPLVEGAVHAEKMLVFSSRKTPAGNPANPAIGAKLVNNTGMKLPAGPITVYDGGTYAGDALIAFFPEGETRIISYGEDLSVTGSFTDLHSTKFSAASVKGGVMAVRQQRSDERVYRFRNASGETKRLVVEHPFRKQPAKLVTPTDYIEKTSDLYRFELFIPPGELTFSVIEEEPIIRNVILSKIPRDEFIYYSTNQDYPEAVRSALLRAIELKQSIDAEKEKLDDIQNRLKRLFDEQNRTRKNLEAAGPQTQQGQNYLSRLAAQDNDIDELNKAISDSEKALKSAQRTYDEYIQDMCFAEEGICFGV